MPFTKPNSGTKAMDRHIAPTNSMKSDTKIIFLQNFMISDVFSLERESCISNFFEYDSFSPLIITPSVAIVIKPRPPICINIMMTNFPKSDQYVPVSATISPVTHTEDVEVKSASKKPMLCPFAEEKPIFKMTAPIKIMMKNPPASIWECDNFFKIEIFISSPEKDKKVFNNHDDCQKP